jgi:hypothetical protein
MSPTPLNVAQPVECASRTWIIVGLIALVLEGAVAILSLAAVALINICNFDEAGCNFDKSHLAPAAGRLMSISVRQRSP